MKNEDSGVKKEEWIVMEERRKAERLEEENEVSINISSEDTLIPVEEWSKLQEPNKKESPQAGTPYFSLNSQGDKKIIKYLLGAFKNIKGNLFGFLYLFLIFLLLPLIRPIGHFGAEVAQTIMFVLPREVGGKENQAV